MKKLLALILCIVMCLSLTVGLTACGGEYPEDSAVVTEDEAKELIVGDWNGKILIPEDIAEDIKSEFSDVEDYIDLSTVTVDVTLRFAENGKGKMTMSKEEVKAFGDALVDVISVGTVKYLREKFKVSDEDWQEYLDEIKMTEQELIDSVLENFKVENMIGEAANELENVKFNYKIENGKLYFSDTNEFTEEGSTEYKMTENALYIQVDDIAAKFTKAE